MQTCNRTETIPMNPTLPSDAELAILARQVDEQLQALQSAPAAHVQFRSVSPGESAELPAAPEQQAAIEKAAGEPFESFWQKYQRQLRRDLCLPGGLLYGQWQKWRDLQSKDSVKVAYGILAGMGIPTASLGPVAVAASVFLLNVAVKAGVEVICEGCAEEEAARKEEAEAKSTQG